MISPLLRKALLVVAVAGVVMTARGDALTATAGSTDLASRLEALRTLSLIHDSHQANAFFAELNLSDVQQAVALLDAAPAKPINASLLHLAFERWGQLDGAAAYADARSRTTINKPRFECAALSGWADHDPDEAWLVMMQISNRGADRRYDQLGLLARIAKHDLELALQFFEDLVPDRTCLECTAANLASIAYQHGRLHVIKDRLPTMPNGPLRSALRHGYWSVYGCYDAAGALRHLEDLAGSSDYREAHRNLCGGWARSDFDACLDYILQTSADEQPDLISIAIQQWAAGAVAEDVAAVVTRLPSPLDERALLGTAPVLAAINPAVTMQLIEAQPESPMRMESFDRAMKIWTRIDGEAAGAYVRSRDDVSTRGTLLWTYLLSQVRNHALTRSDLELVDDRFNPAWSAKLLERIAVQLVDPANRGSSAFDHDAFITFVQSRDNLTDQQKEKILQPLN